MVQVVVLGNCPGRTGWSRGPASRVLAQHFGVRRQSRGPALNIFAFFTVLSNVVVGVTTMLLAINPNRSSAVFAVFRLIGLVAITVTFIVFHVVLSRLLDLDTWAEVANQLLHTVVPIMAIVGWCLFGPRVCVGSASSG